MKSRILTLIGYRGSGKSTVAPILATRLGCDWIDADVEIERRSKRTIQEIFQTGGEEEFRELERALMQELLSGPPIIIAAGGGAILNQSTRSEMKSAGPVIWLTASAEELARRITTDPTTGERRPSLTGQNVEDEVADVLESRKAMYSDAATLQVPTENQTADQIADAIMDRTREETQNKFPEPADDSAEGQKRSGDRPC